MLVPVTTSVWGMEYSVHACPKKHKAEAQAMFPGLDVSDLLVVPTCQVRRFCRKHATNLENALHVLTPRTPTLPSPQRTKMDIVKTGEEVDEEKDLCLERFLDFAKKVCDALIANGHWADYIDPCSGTSFPLTTFRLCDCPYSYQKGLLRSEGTIPSDCYPDCLLIPILHTHGRETDPFLLIAPGLSMVHRDSQSIYGEVDALVTLLNYQTTNSGCCKVVLHPQWGSAVYPASLFTKAPAAEFQAAVAAAETAIRAADEKA